MTKTLARKLKAQSGRIGLQQKGFMMVGLIAAVGVVSLLGGVIASSVFVFAESNSSNEEHNRVSDEITKIDRWFSRDVRRHIANDLLDGVPATSATFSLSTGGGATTECTYELVDGTITRECDGMTQVVGRNVTELVFVRSGDTVVVSFEVTSPVRLDVSKEESVSLKSDISSELSAALCMATSMGSGPSCPLPSIDFNTDSSGSPLSAGDIVDNQWSDDGVTVSAENAGGRVAMIFDSANPTGGDPDLGAPHQDFGGPGQGNDGRSGQPYANSAPLGNLLIVSEDGDMSDPDDNAAGGTLVFHFATPASVGSVQFLDIEEDFGSIETLDGLGQTIDVVTITEFGDNGTGWDTVNSHGVSELRINIPGSGSVSAVNFICS